MKNLHLQKVLWFIIDSGCTYRVEFWPSRTVQHMALTNMLNLVANSKLPMSRACAGGCPTNCKSFTKTRFHDSQFRNYILFFNVPFYSTFFSIPSVSATPALLLQDDEVLAIVTTCAWSLARAIELMDGAGLVLHETESLDTCFCWHSLWTLFSFGTFMMFWKNPSWNLSQTFVYTPSFWNKDQKT